MLDKRNWVLNLSTETLEETPWTPTEPSNKQPRRMRCLVHRNEHFLKRELNQSINYLLRLLRYFGKELNTVYCVMFLIKFL